MSKKEILINELDDIPEPFLDELLDFIHFLKAKLIRERIDTAIASESSLRKDWLSPEEDSRQDINFGSQVCLNDRCS